MTTNPGTDASQRSRTILRQKLESLYRSGVQQIARLPQAAIPIVQEVAIVAEPLPEPPRAPTRPPP
jgi:hypothetical protein